MEIFFSKQLLWKFPEKNAQGQFLFGNVACNFKVFTNKVFTIIAYSFPAVTVFTFCLINEAQQECEKVKIWQFSSIVSNWWKVINTLICHGGLQLRAAVIIYFPANICWSSRRLEDVFNLYLTSLYRTNLRRIQNALIRTQ